MAQIYGYRTSNGEVEAKKFNGDELPKGWVDSPAKLRKKPAQTKKTAE